MWNSNRHVGMRREVSSEDTSLKKFIIDVPDFPKKGIIFRDITPLLASNTAMDRALGLMCYPQWTGISINKVASPEARGFILGPLVAYKLSAGFIPIRKKGKLPRNCEEWSYQLEYAIDTLTVHSDAICKDENILIVDDVLATGGSASAVVNLIRKLGGNIVGAQFLIELDALEGRTKLDIPVNSVLHY